MNMPDDDVPAWLKWTAVALFVAFMTAWGWFLSWLQIRFAVWAPLLTMPPLFVWALWYARRDPVEWAETKRWFRDVGRVLTLRKPSAPLLLPMPKAMPAQILGRWIIGGLIVFGVLVNAWHGFK